MSELCIGCLPHLATIRTVTRWEVKIENFPGFAQLRSLLILLRHLRDGLYSPEPLISCTIVILSAAKDLLLVGS